MKVDEQELLEAIRAGITDGLLGVSITEAIRAGVDAAITRMIWNGTDAPGSAFFEAVENAVKQSLPIDRDAVIEAITQGVSNAMPWPSEIAQAIASRTKQKKERE
jgi:hypothetical protein